MKHILSLILIPVVAVFLLSTIVVAQDNIYAGNDDTLIAPVQPQVSCSNPEPAINDILALKPNTTVGQGCIECGQTCILNGTPCCDPCKCKGKFPNTTCQQ